MKDTFGVALGEASTWRSAIVLLTVIGVNVDPAAADLIATAGASIFGLVGLFTKRKS